MEKFATAVELDKLVFGTTWRGPKIFQEEWHQVGPSNGEDKKKKGTNSDYRDFFSTKIRTYVMVLRNYVEVLAEY